MQTIERMYDRFLTAQVNSAQTTLSGIDAYYAEVSQIDNLLADPSAGLSPALQDFFSGVQQVAANPSLLSARESMVSSASMLVNRFHSLDSRLSELSDEVNGKIQDAVAGINSIGSQIAELNQRIVLAEASYGQPANDLLDQRDQLVNDLNKLVKGLDHDQQRWLVQCLCRHRASSWWWGQSGNEHGCQVASSLRTRRGSLLAWNRLRAAMVRRNCRKSLIYWRRTWWLADCFS